MMRKNIKINNRQKKSKIPFNSGRPVAVAVPLLAVVGVSARSICVFVADSSSSHCKKKTKRNGELLIAFWY